MRVPYSWLMSYVDSDIPAQELAEVLTMGGLEVEEVEEWTSADGEATDQVLLTSVTSNRGDLLSMVGVARHAAALLRCGLKLPETIRPEASNRADRELQQGDSRITIEDPDGCPRYSALRMTGMEVRPSPQWLAHRLEAAGMRPIDNIVDATNYVLWEFGQPLHAFDHKLLVDGHIIVRRAKPGEKLTLIDGNARELNENDLVIADKKGAVALAGVMGGGDTEIRERTTDILIESAHFDPTLVRRTAQRLTISTEASYRFERFVDPNMTLPALARVAEIIEERGGGTAIGAAMDVMARDFTPKLITLRPARTNHLLGLELTTGEQIEMLERLGFETEPEHVEAPEARRDWLRPYPDEMQALERLTVRVPTRRPDIEREVDLIEEIAIVHGYDKIPATLPQNTAGAGMRTDRQKLEQRVSEVMRAAGLCENVSYSMIGGCDLDLLCMGDEAKERDALCLRSPAAENQELMRTTLLPGLLAAARDNVHQRVTDVALFESGRVFRAQDRSLPEEGQRLGALCMGCIRTSTWNLPAEYEQMDFYWLKGVIEQLCRRLNVGEVRFDRGSHDSLHPGRTAKVIVGGDDVGTIGEVSPKVQKAYDLPGPATVMELDLERLLSHAELLAIFEPQPRVPAARRDLSVVVDDDEKHTGEKLLEATHKAGGEFLESVRIFDVYIDAEHLGKGRKSVALNLTFRHPERTLTDDEVDEAMACIQREMERKLQGEVRTW